MKIQIVQKIQTIATAVKHEFIVLEKFAENTVVPFLVNAEKAITGQKLEPTGNKTEDAFLKGIQIASQIEELSGNQAIVQQVAEAIANGIVAINNAVPTPAPASTPNQPVK